MADAVRRIVREAYLRGSGLLIRRLLGGRSGARSFERIVIVAALAKQNGISRGAVLQWQALRDAGHDVELLDATPALRNPLFRLRHRPGSAYIFHSGGPQTASLLGGVLPDVAQAYRIGYWAWELPDPPPDWHGSDANLDEIWTPSRFSRESLLRLFRKPIMVVPHYLPPQRRRARDPGRPFTVLAMADSRSSLSRKNPAGAVRAFAEAFGDSPSAQLILKLSGRDAEIASFTAALGPLAASKNMEIVAGHLDDDALEALYGRADVLLSLHRAEGFGLPMLEAMARGIPVVATGWSGNTDFTDRSNSVLVPYRLVAVDDAAAIYHGSRWAEPDLAAAAAGLRRLAGDAAFYDRMAEAAFLSLARAKRDFPLSESASLAAA